MPDGYLWGNIIPILPYFCSIFLNAYDSDPKERKGKGVGFHLLEASYMLVADFKARFRILTRTSFFGKDEDFFVIKRTACYSLS
jgi:hypothetical protein